MLFSFEVYKDALLYAVYYKQTGLVEISAFQWMSPKTMYTFEKENFAVDMVYWKTRKAFISFFAQCYVDIAASVSLYKVCCGLSR